MTVTQDRPSEAVQQRTQRVWSWVGWHLMELGFIAAALLMGLTVYGPLAWLALVGLAWLAVGPLLGRRRTKTRPERSGRQVTDPAIWMR